MPYIQNPVTVSGEFNIGAVEIQDQDSDLRAEVTQAGLMVDVSYIRNPITVAIPSGVVVNSIESPVDITGTVSVNAHAVSIPSGLQLNAGTANIGTVKLQDTATSTCATVNQVGLVIDIGDPLKIGTSAFTTIGATQTRLDMTPLVGIAGYPMEVELEAQSCPCVVYQGGSTVNLPASHYKRIREDEWQMITVSGVSEAYVACRRYDFGTTASGLLVATRIDSRF